jgi:hypothetical protein
MNNIFLMLRSAYRLDNWRGRTLLAFTILLVLLISIRIALTPSIIYATTSWLKGQGIDAHIEDIEIRIADGMVTLIEARGEKDGKQLFHIGKVHIDWRWTPLSNKTISVTGIELEALKADIALYDDMAVVGGLSIPLGTDDAAQVASTVQQQDDEPVKPWAAELGTISFRQLEACYLQHHSTLQEASPDNRFVDYCLKVDDLAWQGTIGYGLDAELVAKDPVPVMIKGDFDISGINIIDNRVGRALLVSDSNSIDGFDINGLNDIRINKLTMQGLSALQRDDNKHIDAVRYSRVALNDIRFTDLDTLDVASIEIDEPGLYIVKDTGDDWEYQQWIPASKPGETAGESSNQQPDAKVESRFALTLRDIRITAPDMCYLDKPLDLYYCFTQQTLDWQGEIRHATGTGKDEGLNIKGALALTDTRIRNLSLSRDLVEIDAIKLNNISVKPDMSATLGALSIGQLKALQRSEQDDDYTSSFSSLDVNDIAYSTNSLAIDTVTLKGLKNQLSKNEDGSFEHDKWIPGATEKETDKTQSADPPSKQASDSADDQGEKFIISLNKLLLDTDQSTLFTDNSTEPPMLVGLTRLRFEVDQLDAAKPQQDSTIKLHATTRKHSTIDLAGTARPFADKISFDLDGDLKGFDLKVASPATRKAIGHIIRSGQLDAGLDLLATEGKLDSNIALSLYHFNIESVSKEDAAELDKKLGIPLNKTLILLRDKDDSIHLDIPITGDVTNPDFDPMDAIVKATTKAATVAAITFYTPYGLVYAGGNVLFDLATAMNFDPVEFEPGDATLDDKDRQQLDDLARLMTEKPAIHLTLCGQTNSKDFYTLYPDIEPSQVKDGKTTKVAPDTEQREKLSALAEQRQSAIKDYMVNEKAIAHNRLILCEPEYREEDDAISGVEINI